MHPPSNQEWLLLKTALNQEWFPALVAFNVSPALVCPPPELFPAQLSPSKATPLLPIPTFLGHFQGPCEIDQCGYLDIRTADGNIGEKIK